MQFDSECRMTVYFQGSSVTMDCSPKECLGRNLLAVIAESQPIGAAVKIRSGDSLYLGEIWACWPTEDGACVVVKLVEVLRFASEMQALWGGCSGAAGAN